MSENRQGPSIASFGQKIASILILGVLILVGAWVYTAQFDFNYAVLAGRQAADLAQKAAGSTGDAHVPALEAPPGLTAMGKPSRFLAQTLSDKIDGKAELYLSAGFVSLVTRRFRFSQDPYGWLEAYIFEMKSDQSAFSVFSSQRRDDGPPIDMANEAYRTQNAAYLRYGPYYLELVAAVDPKEHWPVVLELAKRFIAAHPVETKAPDRSVTGADLFPRQGFLPESLTLLSTDVFGWADLDNVYTAEYAIKAGRVLTFVSRRKTEKEAAGLAKGLADFYREYGGEVTSDPTLGSLVEIMDTHEVIFSMGPFLAGVHEAPDPNTAADLARLLKAHLSALSAP